MDVNFTLEANDCLRVFINGKLAGEIYACNFSGVESFEEELRRARMLEVLPKIFVGNFHKFTESLHLWKEEKSSKEVKKYAAERKIALIQGFSDGLEQIEIPYPGTTDMKELSGGMMVGQMSFPGIRPEGDCDYNHGYDLGEALAKILKTLSQANRAE